MSASTILEVGGREEVASAHGGNAVYSIAFSPLHHFAVTTANGSSQAAIVWEGKGGRNWKKAKDLSHPSGVYSCSFHPYLHDGLVFATACSDGGVRLYRIEAKKAQGGEGREGEEEEWEVEGVKEMDPPLPNQSARYGGASSILFSSCGAYMAVGHDSNNTVCMYSVNEGEWSSSEVGSGGERWPSIQLKAVIGGGHTSCPYQYARPAFSTLTSSMPILAGISGSAVNVWGRQKEEGGQKESWSAAQSRLSASSSVVKLAFASSSPSYSFHPRQFDTKRRREGKRKEESAKKGERGASACAFDILAAGCNNGYISVWSVDTSRSPASFSPPGTLSGEHSGYVLGLAFSTNAGSDCTLLFSADNNGVVCIWKGLAPPHSSTSPPSLSSPPTFACAQRLNANGNYLADCAISPFGRTFAVVQHNNNLGVQFWHCPGTESVKRNMFGGRGPLPIGLVAECVSPCEVKKIEDECFALPATSFFYPHLASSMRPRCTQLLAELQHGDDEEEEKEKQEEEGCEGEEKGDKNAEDTKKTEEAVPAKSVKHMLTAAAGFYSSDVDVQKRVEKSLTALIPALPSLIEQCRQNQVVLSAMHAMVGREEEEEREREGEEEEKKEREGEEKPSTLAKMRAALAGELISQSRSTFSALAFDDVRAAIEEELEGMRKELERVEVEVRERTLRERGEEEASRTAFLHAVRTVTAEKARVAIPYLLTASDELELDLLELSDKDLCSVLMTDKLQGVKEESVAMLRNLKGHSSKIEKGQDPASCLRTTSSLSCFLSGSPPEGLEEDPAFVASMSALSDSDKCKSSTWRCEYKHIWDWLSSTRDQWLDLEKRITEELDKSSTPADFPTLSELLDELRDSSVFNPKLDSALSERLQYITRVSVSGQSVGDEEEERLEDRIRMALSRESTVEDFADLKKLLQELRSSSEANSDLDSALVERLRFVFEKVISM